MKRDWTPERPADADPFSWELALVSLAHVAFVTRTGNGLAPTGYLLVGLDAAGALRRLPVGLAKG